MKNFRQLSKSVAEQKLTTEAKEKTEYDYEGDMARGQLQSVINNAQRVHDMLEDNDNLPEWVQSKITLAEDYISTVANYMMSELDEGAIPSTEKVVTVRHKTSGKELVVTAQKAKEYQKQGYHAVSEEVDQIDELSNDMLGRYKTAAGADASKADKAGDYNKGNKRFGGIVKATNKQFANDMKKEEVMVEREDDEYHTPSRHHVQVQVSKGDGPKEHRKATVRAKEPSHAVSAAISHYKSQGYTVHDHKYLGEETIQEGRPSQRHPLEGHEYHKKSNAELEYIAKDAHKAAEAMKSHNTTAENKYRDQANDSATVRHYRKTNGMPEWYKKKYGHMKEAFRPMDEPNYNNSIQARQKKADDNKPPFDGPYSKTSSVTTDKSGAKHGPMSVAKHLAKQAMQRQSASLKKPVKEQAMSNKAKIVKDAAKKKKTGESEDAFQSEPIMTKSPTKNY
jgi:hypothetical protein